MPRSSQNAAPRRILVVAFEGWNDAGEAASSAVRTIASGLDLQTIASVDPEAYFDYQYARPAVGFGPSGEREITWPSVHLRAPRARVRDESEGSGIWVLQGSEPARGWQAFTAELVDLIAQERIDLVVCFGAMLADAPHTRPLTVFASSDSPELRRQYAIEQSSYEGPTGALGVLAVLAQKRGIPTISLWAPVPHYVQNPPSPKAALALVTRFTEITGVTVDVSELDRDSQAWVAQVDALAAGDEDMAGYIEHLERTRDAQDEIDGSGEVLAEEFERYLRRADDKGEGEARGSRG